MVGGEGKGAIRGRITRVVAAAISFGKGGHFANCRRLFVEAQVFPSFSSENFVISVE